MCSFSQDLFLLSFNQTEMVGGQMASLASEAAYQDKAVDPVHCIYLTLKFLFQFSVLNELLNSPFTES